MSYNSRIPFMVRNGKEYADEVNGKERVFYSDWTSDPNKLHLSAAEKTPSQEQKTTQK